MFFLKLLVNYLIVAVFFIPEFIYRCFGNVDFYQLTFFLFTENGTLGTDFYVLRTFFLWVVLRPAIIVLVSYVIYRFLIYPKFRSAKLIQYYKLILPIMLFIGIGYNFISYGGHLFAKRLVGEDLMPSYFAALPNTTSDSKSKNNLILLYIESLENTFSNEDVFGRNLNSPLDSKLGISPYKIKQAPGTGWTTAGMIASQCGMPLASFMGNNLRSRAAPIFGNLSCIGDILEMNNYKQAFFVGPDLKFSGMDKFYLNHGFSEAYGKNEIFKSLHKNEFRTGWGGGVNDDILLEIAYEHIKSDLEKQNYFNVTIATTDNHAPDGILSPRCQTENLTTQLAEVVLCTNKSVAKFIDKLKALDVFENTVLVVMGDHKFMGELGTEERSVYFNYFGSNTKELKPTIFELTHFDVFPTLLQLTLGVETNRAHLGHNIFAKDLSRYKELQEYIFGDSFLIFSEFYRSFWGKKVLSD